MSIEPDLVSPRLQALRDELARGDGAALSRFWAEVEARAAPLIEPDAADPTISIVTFLWREVEPLSHIAVIESFSDGDFADKLMIKLPATDCWYRTYRLRSDVRTGYRFGPNDSLVPRREETDWDARHRLWRRDPLNPEFLDDPADSASLLTEDRTWSILSLPDAAPQPWLAPKPGTPAGQVLESRFRSDILDNERSVWRYRPAQPPEILLVLFDAHRCLSALSVPTVLDNLIAAGAIPPVAAVMLDNVDRGAELPCNLDFLRCLTDELVPWAVSPAGLDFVPRLTVAAGQSYGGLAAAYCALERPDVFAAALSQSGSFWWKPDPPNDERPLVLGDAPGDAFLPALAVRKSCSGARFYLDAGRLENRTFEDGAPSLLASNRHLRDVLIAKGYDVTYREFAGGHDSVWWRSTLADGLIALLGTRDSQASPVQAAVARAGA